MWGRLKRSWRRIAWGATAFMAFVYVVTEFVYYFPLTPTSLDIRGETELPSPRDVVRLIYVGDIKLADTAANAIKDHGYAYIFRGTRRVLQGAHLAVGNLEGPITADGVPNPHKRWSYKVPPGAAKGLADAGFDLMNLANNHIQDCGDVGIQESIQHLRDAGIVPFGGGLTRREAHRPAISEIRGVKVANLGYIPPHMRYRGKKISLRSLAWGRKRGGGAWGGERELRRDIQSARREADVVVVSFHLGDRYQKMPLSFERNLCHRAIDFGADVVVGHGTHIMGPMEVYSGKPIFYSVGNFAFGSLNVRARFGLMAVVDVGVASKRVEAVHALPIYTLNSNPWVRHGTKILVGVQALKVLSRLNQRSQSLGTRVSLRRRPSRGYIQLPGS